ncbi:MAG: hypothetical protein ACLGIZ_04535 [Acidimicrobiia bacterium]|jgi:hypothetical protein
MNHEDLPASVSPPFYDRRPPDTAFPEVCQAIIDNADGWHFSTGHVGAPRQIDVRWANRTAEGVRDYLAAGRAAGAVVAQIEWDDHGPLIDDCVRYVGALRALGDGSPTGKELLELADHLDDLRQNLNADSGNLWRVRMRWAAGGQSVHFQTAERSARRLHRTISKARLAIGTELLEDEDAEQLVPHLQTQVQ